MDSKISLSGTEITLHLSGKIDERFQSPPLPLETAKHLSINFEGIVTINSLGIQRWLDFIDTLPKGIHISFVNCPPCIVLQVNMLQRFLPSNGRMESVLVPFYCNSCDKEFTEKHIVGKDVTTEKGHVYLNKSSSTLCADQNCDVEVDVNRDKFFHFLKTWDS